MIALIKESQYWICDLGYKTNNITSKSKHIFFRSHKHLKNIGSVVKKYENINPDIDKVNYKLKNTFKDCSEKNSFVLI